MATMNVSLPLELKEFVEGQVRDHSFSNSSEYIRDLIRRAQSRERLRQQILDGMTSGPGSEAAGGYFDSLRERAHKLASSA